VRVGDAGLTVWVADDPDERRQGLRGVEQLPPGVDGMLFVFPEPATPSFVMLGALIDLELWLFDDQGVLIGSKEMAPCAAEPCPRYPAPGEVRWALETTLGAWEFELGDLLTTSAFG
jgi:uncharacterized membrane protein (UPF0127 family)